MGAAGFLPSVCPVFPELFAEAYDAAVSGDVALTWEYDALLAETSKILGMSKNATASAKYAISLRGMINKRVMWPQDGTTPEDEARIAAQERKVKSYMTSKNHCHLLPQLEGKCSFHLPWR